MIETGDLDISLLYAIMARAGQMRGRRPEHIGIDELLDLVPLYTNDEQKRSSRLYLDRHLKHLSAREFIFYHPIAAEYGASTFRCKIQGELFVQPALAEFGREPLLPQVASSLEESVKHSMCSQEEKSGMLFRLREAIARQAPDVIAKVVSEVGFRIMGGSR